MSALSDAAVSRLRAVANWPEFSSDRYSVTHEIGRGGMGIVYAAVDNALGRDVAIKISNATAGAGLEHRLAAEARVLAALEHPGIVPVHDVGRLADGRLFYVMKRVRGTTLAEYLQRGGELRDRLRVFERACEAVAFAHAHRILHRDLKPDNVMVGDFGEVMVLDWGVAKTLEPGAPPRPEPGDGTMAAGPGSGTSPGTVLGTHGFMPPEQARGVGGDVDERADVYGLGTILLALLAGREVRIDRGASASAIIPAGLPAPLRSICRRALADRPGDRYESAAALAEDVARFRAGQAVRAHREGAIERTWRLAKVYRTPILLVLAYMIMRTVVALFSGR